MRLKPEQLNAHLQDNLSAFYWVSGDEPLLRQECADLIRNRCRACDFQDREVFTVDRSFDWGQFSHATANLSLFAERKLFELRMATGKADEAAKKALQAYVDHAGSDQVLLLTTPKLERPALKTRWFKSLEAAGVFIEVWPLQQNELRPWLKRRLLQENLSPSDDALQVLIDRIEGNLLAAVQEIEKLKLLTTAQPGQTIQLDAKTVTSAVADSSRYTIFQAIDAALSQDGRRATRILASLRAEGVEIPPLVGALLRELRSLQAMLEQVGSGKSAGQVVQANYVLFNRRQTVGKALQRLTTEQVSDLLEQLRLIDMSAKGMGRHRPWQSLSDLLLDLSGTPLSLHPCFLR